VWKKLDVAGRVDARHATRAFLTYAGITAFMRTRCGNPVNCAAIALITQLALLDLCGKHGLTIFERVP